MVIVSFLFSKNDFYACRLVLLNVTIFGFKFKDLQASRCTWWCSKFITLHHSTRSSFISFVFAHVTLSWWNALQSRTKSQIVICSWKWIRAKTCDHDQIRQRKEKDIRRIAFLLKPVLLCIIDQKSRRNIPLNFSSIDLNRAIQFIDHSTDSVSSSRKMFVLEWNWLIDHDFYLKE